MSYVGHDSTSYVVGGGGGFDTFSDGGSQGSLGNESKVRGSNSLRPVTIKQILEATQDLHDTFLIDGGDITHITFVGRVRSVAEQSTNITYVLDDGTGVLDVKQWVDADSSNEDGAAQQLNGQYVRVLGQLKSFSNKKHVGSHMIRLITDFNEVQYHLLEATAVHLHFTVGVPEQSPHISDSGATRPSVYTHVRSGDMTMDVAQSCYSGLGAGQSLPDTLSHNAKVVFGAIKASSDSNEGIHYNVIRVKSQLSEDEVNNAVDELLAHGAAYTTLDEWHVAAMDF
ncbi:replication protein A, subunit RPA32 [Wilcoxina mikolae CBS 423.85]|nr:replication protein A, subunit RPA32 [Wilcoxina mikolae CBS 423.85]